MDELKRLAKRLRLDQVMVFSEPNIRALAQVDCDSACLTADAVYTDFRYAPMFRRLVPELKVRDIRRLKPSGRRIGYEGSIAHSRFMQLKNLSPRSNFIDVESELKSLRMVKTPQEILALKAAEKLNVEIWNEASGRFAAGMTERDMARIIKLLMVERGDGEAFDTIVSIGANAAECHHVPDDTRWDGRKPVLVDMGVKLNGFCSDLTRNIRPARMQGLYRRVYELVEKANAAAIAAVRPGVAVSAVDKVARDIIRKGGFGNAFGHALGHGVGYEIHEAPALSRRDPTVLSPGMVVTIEPGIYLEGNLGVRIEDMVVVTEDGCEVISR
jgi:Xaa-Pro aminopeptidase